MTAADSRARLRRSRNRGWLIKRIANRSGVVGLVWGVFGRHQADVCPTASAFAQDIVSPAILLFLMDVWNIGALMTMPHGLDGRSRAR
jgi:hypothetical protein